MNFSSILQFRNKKSLAIDVAFYFAISSLIACVLCYFIFLARNSMLKKEISDQDEALKTVGTSQQKDREKEVLSYQKKIKDFSDIFKNHGFASQVFYFMQSQTRQNVWFGQFSMQQKSATVSLSGESDDNESFSRQVAVFEKNPYVKNLSSISSSVGGKEGASGKIKFSFSLALEPKIFSYNPALSPAQQISVPPISPEENNTLQENTLKSGQKLIIVFKIANPQIGGIIDFKNRQIAVEVPSGTNLKSLTPLIDISPKATISPVSGLAQDFTNPIVYKVTAEDGTFQNYTVAVKFAGAGAEISAKKSSTGLILTIVLSLVLAIIIIFAAFLIYKKRFAKQQSIAPDINIPFAKK